MAGPTKLQIKFARKFGRRYGEKPSDLLDVIEHESSFQPGAVSSAGAQGLTQFIPSTAASYGVKYGTSKKAQKSQIKGAAKYLKDLGWGSGSPGEIRKALAGYYGAPSPYAEQVISSEKYSKFDKGKAAKGLLSAGGAKSTTKTSKKKVLTSPAVSYAQDRTAAKLAFIQDQDKDFSDYLAFSDTMKSLKDQPAQYKTLTNTVKKAGDTVKQGGKPIAKGGPTLKGGPKHEVVEIGRWAEKKFGLSVGENPHFGGVAPVHATNSYHYSGRAIDVSGDPDAMRKFAHAVAKRYGPELAELFWQGAGGVNYDNGHKVPQGFVTGHEDHVHVAF